MPDSGEDEPVAAWQSMRSRRSRAGLQLPEDRFIPVHSDDIVDAIVGDRERFPELANMRGVAEMMDRVVDQETTAFQRYLCRRYERFNPARETIEAGEEESTEQQMDDLERMIAYLLEKANFEALDEGEIENTITVANTEGIRIRTDPARLERLELFVRGQTEIDRWRRTMRHPVDGETSRVEVFRRLVVMFQFKGESTLNLKLFRDIPIADVEALLPHAEAAMSILDRIKIAFGGAGAFSGIAWKVATGTAVFGQLAWAAIVALAGLSVRGYFGYRRARNQRMSQMTHNLYYRIVANNAGVIDMLLSKIAQEELKEAILGYALLLADEGDKITESTHLEEAASKWLGDTFDLHVDFDAADAVETMDRFDLWENRASLQPVPPDEALRRLQTHWERCKSERYHIDAWEKLPIELVRR